MSRDEQYPGATVPDVLQYPSYSTEIGPGPIQLQYPSYSTPVCYSNLGPALFILAHWPNG